jgi:hypothetical protein
MSLRLWRGKFQSFGMKQAVLLGKVLPAPLSDFGLCINCGFIRLCGSASRSSSSSAILHPRYIIESRSTREKQQMLFDRRVSCQKTTLPAPRRSNFNHEGIPILAISLEVGFSSPAEGARLSPAWGPGARLRCLREGWAIRRRPAFSLTVTPAHKLRHSRESIPPYP